jgi:hypothetical protein
LGNRSIITKDHGSGVYASEPYSLLLIEMINMGE